MGKLACVIPAAGWGSVCPVRSSPKVLETTGDELMIQRIIRIVLEAGIEDQLAVVVGNNGYGAQIRKALEPFECRGLRIDEQAGRYGAADAVRCALPELGDAADVLVTFGDMPLWRPDTLRRLAKAHLNDGDAAISMVTLRLRPGHSTERYGRIARDERGAILAAFEPSELAGRMLSGAATVNPSLYVFKRKWLAQNLSHIPPVDKGDGHPPELHLPKLLLIAHDQGAKILEVPLEDASEALGVNTSEELDEVRAVIRTREVAMTELRPLEWDDDMERILQFVRQWRAEYGVGIGSPMGPDQFLWADEGAGFLLFSALPRDPEFEGWCWQQVRADAFLRLQLLWRIEHNPQPVV